jgi:hypothetical protein
MTCTYFGATTGKFVLDVLEGVTPDKANPGAFNYVGSEEHAFYAHTDLVVSPDVVLLSASTLTLPAPLTGDLKDAEWRELSAFVLKNRDRFIGVAYCYVNVSYLAQCKLLDMAAFKAALEGHPSPVAMSMAVAAAHETMKPDYPLVPPYDAQLSNFIEQLVHGDLVPLSKESMEDDYPDFDEGYELRFDNSQYAGFKIMTGYNRKADYADDVTVLDIVMSDEDAYISRPVPTSMDGKHPGFCLNLDYLKNQGLFDLDVYYNLSSVRSRIEALQYVARSALNHPAAQPVGTLELPTDLLTDD